MLQALGQWLPSIDLFRTQGSNLSIHLIIPTENHYKPFCLVFPYKLFYICFNVDVPWAGYTYLHRSEIGERQVIFQTPERNNSEEL